MSAKKQKKAMRVRGRLTVKEIQPAANLWKILIGLTRKIAMIAPTTSEKNMVSSDNLIVIQTAPRTLNSVKSSTNPLMASFR